MYEGLVLHMGKGWDKLRVMKTFPLLLLAICGGAASVYAQGSPSSAPRRSAKAVARLEPQLTLYWIDPRAPHAKNFRFNEPPFQAPKAEIADLEALLRAGYARRASTSALRAEHVNYDFVTRSLNALMVPRRPPFSATPTPIMPNIAPKGGWKSSMPRVRPDAKMDSGIQKFERPRPTVTVPITPRDLALSRFSFLPLAGRDNVFWIFNRRATEKEVAVFLQPDTTWLVTGNPLGLKPPSPRFTIPVLEITSRPMRGVAFKAKSRSMR